MRVDGVIWQDASREVNQQTDEKKGDIVCTQCHLFSHPDGYPTCGVGWKNNQQWNMEESTLVGYGMGWGMEVLPSLLWIKSKVLQEIVEALGMKCLLSSICNLLKKLQRTEISLILQSIAIESYSWLLIFYSSYFSWRFSAPFLNVIFYNVFFPPLYHRTILSTIFHFASIPFWGKKLSSHNRWRRCSKEIMNDSY